MIAASPPTWWSTAPGPRGQPRRAGRGQRHRPPTRWSRRCCQARTPARLVHLGSAAEYGRASRASPVAESAPPRPAGAYGATKLAGTRLVELARTAGLDAVVLRVFNPVGGGCAGGGLPGRVAVQLRQAMAGGTDVRLGPAGCGPGFRRRARRGRRGARRGGRAGAAARGHQRRQRHGRATSRTLVKELLAISGYDGRRARGRAGLGSFGRACCGSRPTSPRPARPGLAAVPRPGRVAGRPVGGRARWRDQHG